MTRRLVMGLILLLTIGGLSVGANVLERRALAQTVEAPMFEVDPFWPKPLPNHWVIGSSIGVGVDSRDHVFIIHRQDTLNESTEIAATEGPPTGGCCVPAPPILEFDPEGNLVGSWGGRRYGWLRSR